MARNAFDRRIDAFANNRLKHGTEGLSLIVSVIENMAEHKNSDPFLRLWMKVRQVSISEARKGTDPFLTMLKWAVESRFNKAVVLKSSKEDGIKISMNWKGEACPFQSNSWNIFTEYHEKGASYLNRDFVSKVKEVLGKGKKEDPSDEKIIASCETKAKNMVKFLHEADVIGLNNFISMLRKAERELFPNVQAKAAEQEQLEELLEDIA